MKLNLDTQCFTKKPTAYEVGGVRNRLCCKEAITETDLETLAKAIEQGRAWTPGVMEGTTGKTWKEQWLIVADIDNDHEIIGEDGKPKKDTNNHVEKEIIPNPLTPDNARMIMYRHGIEPAFMYYTFSNKPGHPKFRIVLALEEPLTDGAEAVELTRNLSGIFHEVCEDCADPTMADNARLLFGTAAGGVFFYSGTKLNADILRKLPKSDLGVKQKKERKAKDAGEQEAPKKAAEPKRQAEKRTPANYRTLEELQSVFERDKDAFDMAEYVESLEVCRAHRVGRTTFYNPCPICGHNDDFNCTDNVWYCQGASGKIGGTIIDFLMYRKGHELTEAEAIEHFKFDIMQYDKDEWKHAYYEVKEEERQIAKAERMEEELKTFDWNDEIGEPGGISPAAKSDTQKTEENGSGQTQEEPKAEAPKTDTQEIKLTSNAEYIPLAKSKVTESRPEIKTGFSNLDEALDGGLYEGFYIVGAMSSLGKTSFVLQMCDQMAAAGHYILYFSLEMARERLMYRSVSRETFILSQNTITARSMREIANGRFYGNYTKEQAAKIEEAWAKYGTYAGNIITKAAIGTITIEHIKAVLKTFKEQFPGVTPIIIIDYLQILTVTKDKAKECGTDKQRTDYNTTELMTLASREHVPIIGISSFNRENYEQDVTMAAFKESGSIEYSADVLMALQYEDLDYKRLGTDKNGVPTYETKQAHVSRVKQIMTDNNKTATNGGQINIELKLLKNRDGGHKGTLKFGYYPKYNYFVSKETFTASEPQATTPGRKSQSWRDVLDA